MDHIKNHTVEPIVMKVQKYIGKGIEIPVERKINTGLFSKRHSSDVLSRLTGIDNLDTVISLRTKYG